MFDITTSRDFLGKLKADFEDFTREPHSARLALNCAITAYHLHEWVWGDWLQGDYSIWRELGIRDLETFRDWINGACPWFETVRELSGGAKHFASTDTFKTERLGAPPFMLDALGAGWDEGAWGGPPICARRARQRLSTDRFWREPWQPSLADSDSAARRCSAVLV